MLEPQKAGEPARAGRDRPEQEKADRTTGLAPELERADEAEVHRMVQREEQHRADPAEDERRPQNRDHLPHDTALTMRQVPRESWITACQRPAGSAGKCVPYAPQGKGTSRRRTSWPARVAWARCRN